MSFNLSSGESLLYFSVIMLTFLLGVLFALFIQWDVNKYNCHLGFFLFVISMSLLYFFLNPYLLASRIPCPIINGCLHFMIGFICAYIPMTQKTVETDENFKTKITEPWWSWKRSREQADCKQTRTDIGQYPALHAGKNNISAGSNRR